MGLAIAQKSTTEQSPLQDQNQAHVELGMGKAPNKRAAPIVINRAGARKRVKPAISGSKNARDMLGKAMKKMTVNIPDRRAKPGTGRCPRGNLYKEKQGATLWLGLFQKQSGMDADMTFQKRQDAD
jgi:hypothetical protein